MSDQDMVSCIQSIYIKSKFIKQNGPYLDDK